MGQAGQALGAPGAVILAGERLAEVPGALAAAARLAVASGARLAWVPRRAGERGAIEAGALPGLLPIGRPVTDAAARAEVARAWGKSSLPAARGRDTAAMLAAAAAGELGALVVAGVDPADLPDPQAALHAIEMTPFVVSLELRASAVTDRADVVFPVAAVAEKAGTFVNWEGRGGSFARRCGCRRSAPTCTCWARSPTRWTCTWACPTRRPRGPSWPRSAPGAGSVPSRRPRWAWTSSATKPSRLPPGSTMRLATWRQLLDSGRMQDGEPSLAGTARPVVARMSAATAAEAGIADGDKVTVATGQRVRDGTGRGRADGGPRGLAPGRRAGPGRGSGRAAAVPGRARPAIPAGSTIRAQLGAGHGDTVTLRRPE